MSSTNVATVVIDDFREIILFMGETYIPDAEVQFAQLPEHQQPPEE